MPFLEAKPKSSGCSHHTRSGAPAPIHSQRQHVSSQLAIPQSQKPSCAVWTTQGHRASTPRPAISRQRDRSPDAACALHRRPRGRLSVAPLPPWSALRAPRTPPMLLLAPRPAPDARASVRQPLRPGQPPPGGLPWPAGPAPVARGGGAVAALKPAPARQTGRGESWATRVRALGGAEAAEKSSQVKSSQ